MVLKLDMLGPRAHSVVPSVAEVRLRHLGAASVPRHGPGLASEAGVGPGLLLAVAGAGAAGGLLAVTVLAVPDAAPHRLLPVHLHVLPQAGGVGVGLVAAPDLAVVRLVRGVHVGVLLSVAGVSKPPVTPIKLALEWFLTWNK